MTLSHRLAGTAALIMIVAHLSLTGPAAEASAAAGLAPAEGAAHG